LLSEVVTKESASLGSKNAEELPDYDHRQIARFQDRFEYGYLRVVSSLTKIKDALGVAGILAMPTLKRVLLHVPCVNCDGGSQLMRFLSDSRAAYHDSS
jgi:hypothetical protein